MLKRIFIGLLLLPLLELGAFLAVAGAIGWLRAMVLFIGTSVLGAVLLRRYGSEHFLEFRRSLLREGAAAVRLDTPGLAGMLGALLLLLPGFITDAIGLCLFIPPLRRWAAATLGRALRPRPRAARRRAEPTVLDLNPGDWHQISTEPLNRQRARREDESSGNPG